ncbi:MAG: GatB/YqeY domain-containing protein [Planctomycetes bacterium]|nr:GatB/YqeY domain-containing protein [Planctomycetota bacterium]
MSLPTLLAKLQDDMKAAMKSGDTLTRDTLRLAIADLKKKELDLARDLKPEEELAVLHKCVKSREDSVTQFDAAARKDLADKERAEIGVLQRYLPKMLPEDATRALVQQAIAKLGVTSKKDLGQVMKAVLAEHKGKVAGSLVQRIAGELLT